MDLEKQMHYIRSQSVDSLTQLHPHDSYRNLTQADDLVSGRSESFHATVE